MGYIVPEEFRTSQSLNYIITKNLEWKQTDHERCELESCPFCNKGNYGHFYVVTDGSNRDGLWICHKCGKSGNLKALKDKFGDFNAPTGAVAVQGNYQPEMLPDVDVLHENLLCDESALEYLTDVRGFSLDIIKERKLGLAPERHFRKAGKTRALVYPYFNHGIVTFIHYRTLPPAQKDFNSPKGYEAPLYNEEILKPDLTELIAVEGEANVISALDHGITNIVGVPGANFKKSLWITRLDEITLEKVYICYDKDTVGQNAAQTLASKIGINKCYKIILPDFTFTDDEGNIKTGKDLNEWFRYGNGTKEKFEELKNDAKLFDVKGVKSTADALEELERRLNSSDTGLQPKYFTPWPKLNQFIGFDEADVVDIVAPEKTGKSTFGMNLIEHMVNTYNENGIIICMEMSNIKMVRKWVCHKTNTPDRIQLNYEEIIQQKEQMQKAISNARSIAENRDATLYFCYPPYIKTVEDMYNLIYDCIRRYNVKWIMVDNIQLLCDKTLKSQGHRTIHLSQISKELATIAKDYNVQILRILQPHRILDGKIITTDDVDGASQIAKDCDCMMTLWRKRVESINKQTAESENYIEESLSFEPILTTTIGLSRYTSGGTVKLFYDGETSTVKDFDEAMGIQAVKAAVAMPVEDVTI